MKLDLKDGNNLQETNQLTSLHFSAMILKVLS